MLERLQKVRETSKSDAIMRVMLRGEISTEKIFATQRNCGTRSGNEIEIRISHSLLGDDIEDILTNVD